MNTRMKNVMTSKNYRIDYEDVQKNGIKKGMEERR